MHGLPARSRIDPLFPVHTPARASSAYVTFEPGARTVWHTHPLGQSLIITAGVGRVQVQGGPIQEVRPGDTVWFPPYVKHWHGAAPGVAMTHISVAEEEDGEQRRVAGKSNGRTIHGKLGPLH